MNLIDLLHSGYVYLAMIKFCLLEFMVSEIFRFIVNAVCPVVVPIFKDNGSKRWPSVVGIAWMD